MRSASIGMAVCLAGAFLMTGVAGADGTTQWFEIEVIGNNWGDAGFTIQPVGSVENPDGCTNLNQYQSMPSVPGNNQRLSLAMMADLSGRRVKLRLSGCTSSGRPSLISVQVE